MCSDVMRVSRGAHTQASWPPLCKCGARKLLMNMLFAPAELYLRKLAASHFSTLNMKIANQNVVKRILIAMHNENKLIAMRTSRYVQRNP